ncbi:hypothetical protein CLHUN_38270 [Ruminiclostridium hungatei]|uniref:Uncharacterized protein n=1 Tax=Ruminiclostridium hungatei TaxID=48256 RepID=A0A1V4SFL8_RUMHU|nr:DUF5345 family protein [Ruminiclostridium hungatei]OPX42306.1 hypothetical protein CLHUN_38270 [Ruminiclostridium hungatei]
MDEEKRITDGLKEISEKIDAMDISTPDLMSLMNFISDRQASVAAKNNKHMAIFSCTALAVISSLAVLFQLSALAFAIVQGLLVTVPAVLLLIKRGKRNELT